MTSVAISEILRRAIAHHRAGEMASAEALYREILTHDPNYAEAWHLLGVLALQHGQGDAAIELISRALQLGAGSAVVHANLGEAYRRAGRLPEAIRTLTHALALQPDFVDALNNLGNAQQAVGDFAGAIDSYRRAIALRPEPQYHHNLGLALQGNSQPAQAIAEFNLAVALAPDFGAPYHGRAMAALALGRLAEAQADLQRALALEPRNVQFLAGVGELHKRAGELDAAAAIFAETIRLDPQSADGYYNLGNVRLAQTRLDEALQCFAEAIARRPTFAAAWNNRGNALMMQGRLPEARAAFLRAIDIHPDYADAHANLGDTLRQLGELDEAAAALEHALVLKPDSAVAHNNLARVRDEQGHAQEAIEHYRAAVRFAPHFTFVHSNLICTLLFNPHCDPATLRAEHQRWEELHAAPLAPGAVRYANAPAPERRLRIGYVSPDFCQHVIGRNVWPLIREHSRAAVEVFCYADVVRPDDLTRQFATRADVFRSILGQSDAQVADQMRRDGIDIAVDLSLHLARNRLLVFARKPAPVQVTFAGYPGTTGLSAIDYRLTDPFLDPPGASTAAYSEESVRLAHSFWCYEPAPTDPPVNPLPAATRGYITFGCLNNFAKINSPTLQLWARVLTEVPGSRLRLLALEGRHRQAALRPLIEAGIAADRVEFVTPRPRAEYMQLYHQVDLGLDSLPYNGHSTSLDSYWMGVPVVTLVGQTVVGRAGWSQLSNLGLTELAAHTADEFVRLAVDLARDQTRLAELRRTLRDRMQRSPLTDARGFARDIEAAYRTMWRRWCARITPAA